MRDHIDLAFDFLDHALVSEDARERLRSISAHLPLLQVGGFEIRLADHSPTVDLFTCLEKQEFKPFADEFDAETWRLLKRCIETTENQFSEFYPFIKRIDLEFDLDIACSRLRMPSIFFNLIKGFGAGQFISLNTLQNLRAHVLGNRDSHTTAAVTRNCYDRRPKGSFISYIGMMARDDSQFRLVLGGVGISSIHDYLKNIGLVSLIASVDRIIHQLAPFVSPICMIDLDIGETIHPKVGIEFYIYPPNNVGLWSKLLDTLVNMNLCTQQKGDGLKTWLNSKTLPASSTNNPVRSTALFPCGNENAVSIFWRSINHVKLTFSANQTFDCKAYLGFGSRCVENLPATKQFEIF